MPRVSATTEDETVVKKTTRRRAAPKKKATVTKTDVKKTAPKKPVTKKTASPKKKTAPKKAVVTEEHLEDSATDVVEVTDMAMAAATKKRKAPTVFANETAKKRAVKTQIIVVSVLLIMGVGASAAVGFNDSSAGQINVEETIRVQNAKMANMVDVDGPTIVAPSPNRATVPDGGLIPSADQTKRAPAAGLVPSASSSATSSEQTATSSDDGVEAQEQLDAESPPTNIGGGSAVDTATTTVTATNQIDQATLTGPVAVQ